MTTDRPDHAPFTRGFRLVLPNGQHLDGAAFPSGRTVLLDDPEFGFATGATSLDELLLGYHGARVVWADDAAHTATEDGRRLTVDTITSNQLDALLLQAARMQHAVQQYAELRVRLEDAEAAVIRAHEWADELDSTGQLFRSAGGTDVCAFAAGFRIRLGYDPRTASASRDQSSTA